MSRNRPRGPLALALGLLTLGSICVLTSCGEDGPAAPGPAATPSPSPSPTATPTPSPTPTPTPTATPTPSNRPPTVSILGGGSCHPSASGSRVGARSCSVAFRVEAQDPDGDSLNYSWSGCTAGSGTTADCTIAAPGAHSAVVTVRDGRGGVTTATATAQGVNQPPVIRIGSPRPPNPAPPATQYFIVGGQPEDPDQDEEPNILCTRVQLTSSGPCTAGPGFACGGVGDVFDFSIRTSQGPGTCTVEAQVRDSWGAVASDRFSFQVNASR